LTDPARKVADGESRGAWPTTRYNAGGRNWGRKPRETVVHFIFLIVFSARRSEPIGERGPLEAKPNGAHGRAEGEDASGSLKTQNPN
jgi:hypothetical protein